MKSKNLICLEKMQREYELSHELIQMARKEVNKSTHTNNQESFKQMIAKFPKGLQRDLFVGMFRKSLQSINMFRPLPEDVLVMLGKVLVQIIYMPSKRDQPTEFTLRGTWPTRSTSSRRAAWS